MVYIYYDPETGEEMEVEHPMNEDPIVTNKKTGNIMKKKITGGVGVIYKAGGFSKSTKRDNEYQIDKRKDEIRGGIKEDPYKKWRGDEPI
jgi:predicted nucleic acid-binding Zn ribbon protein